MHAADRNTNCVQHNKTHVDKSARCRANSKPRTPTMTENGARVSEPRHVTKTQDMSAGIQTPRSNMKQGTQTRERATRAHSKPHAHMKTRTWWEYQGSVTKPRITLDRSDRTLTGTLLIHTDWHPFKVNEFPDQCTDLLVDISSLPSLNWCPISTYKNKKAKRNAVSYFQVGWKRCQFPVTTFSGSLLLQYRPKSYRTRRY